MADWVFQNAIVREQSFRGKSYQDAVGKFSSFLEVNMAYVQMERGVFVEDGWEDCNLLGLIILDGRK